MNNNSDFWYMDYIICIVKVILVINDGDCSDGYQSIIAMIINDDNNRNNNNKLYRIVEVWDFCRERTSTVSWKNLKSWGHCKCQNYHHLSTSISIYQPLQKVDLQIQKSSTNLTWLVVEPPLWKKKKETMSSSVGMITTFPLFLEKYHQYHQWLLASIIPRLIINQQSFISYIRSYHIQNGYQLHIHLVYTSFLGTLALS